MASEVVTGYCWPQSVGAGEQVGRVTQFTPLANMYAHMRTLRIADGPDEVHKMTIARREIMKHDPSFRINPFAEGRPGAGAEEEPQPFMRP